MVFLVGDEQLVSALLSAYANKVFTKMQLHLRNSSRKTSIISQKGSVTSDVIWKLFYMKKIQPP